MHLISRNGGSTNQLSTRHRSRVHGHTSFLYLSMREQSMYVQLRSFGTQPLLTERYSTVSSHVSHIQDQEQGVD
jgi:hypothetical protein